MLRRFVSLLAVSLVLLASGRAGSDEKPPKQPAAASDAVFHKPAPQNVADLRTIERRVRTLVDKLMQCTVAVRVGEAHGSGVVVSPDGYVLTAAHVAGNRPGLKGVVFLFADGRQAQGTTLGMNKGLDAGLMKITDKGPWPHLKLAQADSAKVGDWCLATGHPFGFQLDRGPVVRLGRLIRAHQRFLQSDCTLVGGDSGGPLTDMNGDVIGVHSRIGLAITFNFHVPVAAYKDDWERLVKSELIEGDAPHGQVVLGIEGEDSSSGCKVVTVQPQSPAEKAGLKSGDLIVRFNQQRVDGIDRLLELLGGQKPGDQVTLSVRRGDQTIVAKVTLGQQP